MKKINKKGFTLIELLAVIVILAILIAVAVPAITRYLAEARKGTFVDNAQAAITAVRDEMIISSIGTSSVSYPKTTDGKDTKYESTVTDENGKKYTSTVFLKDAVNMLLEKKLKTSPYGGKYTDNSYIKVTPAADGTYTFEICLSDGTHKISGTEENLSKTSVTPTTEDCTIPTRNGN